MDPRLGVPTMVDSELTLTLLPLPPSLTLID